MRRSEATTIATAAALMVASSALAAPGDAVISRRDEPRRRTVVSVPIFGLSSNAIAVQAEHPVARHLSVSLGLGMADSADGDYQATTGALGAELRVWIRPVQRGFFAAPRFETSVTHASLSARDRSLGNTVTLSEGLVGGYRLVLLDHFEVTPVLGLIFFHDLGDERTPAQTRLTMTYSLALGWVF